MRNPVRGTPHKQLNLQQVGTQRVGLAVFFKRWMTSRSSPQRLKRIPSQLMGMYIHGFILTNSDPWDVLHQVDALIPAPSANEVLLRVHAVALSRGGYTMIKHLPSILMKKPAIPEPDVSGTIVSVGTDVRQWAVGDKVFGTMSARELLRERRGGLTEYTLVHADNMLSPLL